MQERIKKTAVFLVISLSLLLPTIILAADPPAPVEAQSLTEKISESSKNRELNLNIPIGDFDGTKINVDLLGEYIKAWYDLLLGTVGIIATILIMWGGFKWLTSRGDSKQISDAQDIIWSAITGMILAFGSFLIISLVDPTLTDISMPTIEGLRSQGSNFDGASQSNPYPGKDFHDSKANDSGTYLVGRDRRSDLKEDEVRKQLLEKGIGVNKSACLDGVAYQNTANGCTSVAGLQPAAINEAIGLKNNCKCNVMITGGTELGHHTSDRGYQIDLDKNSGVDSYITSNGKSGSVTWDGKTYPSYTINGTRYVNEGDHWHVDVTH